MPPSRPRSASNRTRALGLVGALAVASAVAVHLGVRLTEAEGGRREARERLALQGRELAAQTRARRLAEDEAADAEEARQAEALARAGEVAVVERADARTAVLLTEARAALLPLGRLEALERLARSALEPPHAARGEDARLAALDLLGEVLLRRGRTEDAEEPLRDALELLRGHVLREPASRARAHDLALALRRVAAVRLERGDPDGALDLQREALATLRTLNDREPGAAAWLGALGSALSEMAAALAEARRYVEAVVHAEEAVGIAHALAARDDAEPTCAVEEARAQGVLGDVRVRAGSAADAVPAYRAALDRLAPLSERPGADAGLAALQADLWLRLGTALGAAGSPVEAVGALRDALDAAVLGVAQGAASLEGVTRLARTCDALSAARETAAQPDDALTGRREAVLVWRRVADLDAADPGRRAQVVQALLRLGDLLARQGAAEAALEAFREARCEVRPAEPAPGAAGGSDLAECLDREAAALLALGRRAEALQAWRDALAVIEPLAKKTPENAFWQADLARLWLHLGTALCASDEDRPEGLRALKRARRLSTALAAPGVGSQAVPTR